MADANDYKLRLAAVMSKTNPEGFLKSLRGGLPSLNASAAEQQVWMTNNLPEFFITRPGEKSEFTQFKDGLLTPVGAVYYLYQITSGQTKINFTTDKMAAAAEVLARTDKETEEFSIGGFFNDCVAAIRTCYSTGKWSLGDISRNYETARGLRKTATNYAVLQKPVPEGAGLSQADAMYLTGMRINGDGKPEYLYAPLYMKPEEKISYTADLASKGMLYDPSKEPGWSEKSTWPYMAGALTSTSLMLGTAANAVKVAEFTQIPKLIRGALSFLPRTGAAAPAVQVTTETAEALAAMPKTLAASRTAMRFVSALKVAGAVGGGITTILDYNHTREAFDQGKTTTGRFGAVVTGVEGVATGALAASFIPGVGWVVGAVAGGVLVVTEATKFVVVDQMELFDLYGDIGMKRVARLRDQYERAPADNMRLSNFDVMQAVKSRQGPVYEYLRIAYGDRGLAIIEQDIGGGTAWKITEASIALGDRKPKIGDGKVDTHGSFPKLHEPYELPRSVSQIVHKEAHERTVADLMTA